ncbi:MAG: TIM barrel protein [Dehalococcoidia bacterium]|nr:TIM barrel protein [Dehalococcoidia bacterium]
MTRQGLLFGTGGTPNSTPPPRSTISGIGRIADLGLGCMELEFVQGVKMSEATAAQVKAKAASTGIRLTAHGPYAINLNSVDPEKVKASKERILKTARVGQQCGAESVVFHAGFYGKDPPAQVYDVVRRAISEITGQLRMEGIGLTIRTELTGKVTDFGTLDEVLQLASEIPGLAPCIDFAHLHARTGAFNAYNEFASVLGMIEKRLTRSGLDNLHAHVSGIQYATHGEVKHLPLKESDFKYEELLRAFHDYSVKGFIICESPILEDDALLLKRTFEELSAR